MSQIFLGNFRNAYLGYSAFVPFAGQGYMTLGLRLVLREAFDYPYSQIADILRSTEPAVRQWVSRARFRSARHAAARRATDFAPA